MPKHATRKNHNNAMNLGLFLGGLGLITAFLAILTITTVEQPAHTSSIANTPITPAETTTTTSQSPTITVDVSPTVTLEVTP